MELVVGGRVGGKKEKKICRREIGTSGVCFAVGEEFRRPLVVDVASWKIHARHRASDLSHRCCVCLNRFVGVAT